MKHLPFIILLIASSSYAQPWFVDRDPKEEARVRAAKWKTVEIRHYMLGVDQLRQPGTQKAIVRYDSLGRKTSYTSYNQRIRSLATAIRPEMTDNYETRYHFDSGGDLVMIDQLIADTLKGWTVIIYDTLHRQVKRKRYHRGLSEVQVAKFEYDRDRYRVAQYTNGAHTGNDMIGEINSNGKFRFVHVIDLEGNRTYSYINTYYDDSVTLKEQRVGTDSNLGVTLFDRDGRNIGTRDKDGNETLLSCTSTTRNEVVIRECKQIYNGGWISGKQTEHRDTFGNVIFRESTSQDPHGRREVSSRHGSRMTVMVMERYE